MIRNLNAQQKKFLLWSPVLFIGCAVIWLIFSANAEPKEIKKAENSPKNQETKKNAKDQTSREIAERFLEDYINFDAKYPERQWKRLESIVTLGFLDQIKGKGKKRGTAEYQSSRFLSIEKADYEKFQEYGEQKIIWTFQVIEEVTDAKGSKIKEESVYAVHLVKMDTWKVFEVEIHGIFD